SLAIQEFNNLIKDFIVKYTPNCVTGQEPACKKVQKRKVLVESNNIQDHFNNLDDFNNLNNFDNSDEFNNYNSDYTQNYDNIKNIDLFLIQNFIVCSKK
ncbi:23583_t:CDS:1, partial [Racocetra persica]